MSVIIERGKMMDEKEVEDARGGWANDSAKGVGYVGSRRRASLFLPHSYRSKSRRLRFQLLILGTCFSSLAPILSQFKRLLGIRTSQRYVHPTPERLEDGLSRIEAYNRGKQ